MRRSLVALAGFLSGCSLVFGLYDNQPPIDAGPDVADASPDVHDAAPDVPPWNGCPAEAGKHTFCEFFDETPPWPADAGMPQIEGSPVLAFDAGCVSLPGCLVSDDANGSAARTIETPGGVNLVTVELKVRHDKIVTADMPVARAFWIDFLTSTGPVTFGVTFLQPVSSGILNDFLFWRQPSKSSVNATPWPTSSTLGKWIDMKLTVEVANGVVELALPPASAIAETFTASNVNISLKPSDVTSVQVHAGMGTAGTQHGVTVDDVAVDIE